MVPSSLIALYKEFFRKNSISSGVEVLSPPGISQLFQKCDPAVKFHFFADELQAFEAEDPNVFIQLGNHLSRITDQDCYCWVAYDYMQRKEDDVSRDETGGLNDALKIQAQARAQACENSSSSRAQACDPQHSSRSLPKNNSEIHF